MQLDPGKRAFTVTGLEANHDYRFRVCAVFDSNRVCSDYASARTMPPPSPPPSATPATPPPAAPKPLPKPTLTATPHTWRQIVLRWEFPGHDVILASAKLYREGGFIYEALVPGNFDSDYNDLVPRPNTEYSYKLCFSNPYEEQCSDEIKAMPAPITPSSPSGVTVAVERRSSGGAIGSWVHHSSRFDGAMARFQASSSRLSTRRSIAAEWHRPARSAFGTLNRPWIEIRACSRGPIRLKP
jgi:hypothetical protein